MLPWNWNLCSLDGDVRQEAYCSYTSYNRSKNHCIALTPLVFKAFSVFLVCSSSHRVCFFYLATCKWNTFDIAILVFMKSIAHTLSTLQKVHKTTDFPFLIRGCLQACSSWDEGWRKHKYMQYTWIQQCVICQGSIFVDFGNLVKHIYS